MKKENLLNKKKDHHQSGIQSKTHITAIMRTWSSWSRRWSTRTWFSWLLTTRRLVTLLWSCQKREASKRMREWGSDNFVVSLTKSRQISLRKDLRYSNTYRLDPLSKWCPTLSDVARRAAKSSESKSSRTHSSRKRFSPGLASETNPPFTLSEEETSYQNFIFDS